MTPAEVLAGVHACCSLDIKITEADIRRGDVACNVEILTKLCRQLTEHQYNKYKSMIPIRIRPSNLNNMSSMALVTSASPGPGSLGLDSPLLAHTPSDRRSIGAFNNSNNNNNSSSGRNTPQALSRRHSENFSQLVSNYSGGTSSNTNNGNSGNVTPLTRKGSHLPTLTKTLTKTSSQFFSPNSTQLKSREPRLSHTRSCYELNLSPFSRGNHSDSRSKKAASRMVSLTSSMDLFGGNNASSVANIDPALSPNGSNNNPNIFSQPESLEVRPSRWPESLQQARHAPAPHLRPMAEPRPLAGYKAPAFIKTKSSNSLTPTASAHNLLKTKSIEKGLAAAAAAGTPTPTSTSTTPSSARKFFPE